MTDDDARQRQANSFGEAAEAYERARPTYPTEAVDWLVPDDAWRVLDLGAGTGKLTRILADRDLEVVAVEPSAGMREQLGRVVPGVPILGGTAEDIPVEDRSVDAVLVGQAWHWMDPARAVTEIARVLTPGGRLGLVWNVRDEREDWVARLGDILHREPDQEALTTRPTIGPPFGDTERFDVEWAHPLDPARLLDLVASRSYVITLPGPERARVLAGVRHLMGTHPDLAGKDEFALPYVTRCSRAHLPG